MDCWLVDGSNFDGCFYQVRWFIAVVCCGGFITLAEMLLVVGCHDCCLVLLYSPVASVVNCWLVDGFNFDGCFCQVGCFIAVGMGHCAC